MFDGTFAGFVVVSGPDHRTPARRGIHAARGDWPVKPTPPFVPGHEGVGVVERVGARVDDVTVGTRVDLAEVFRLHAAGRTKVGVEVRKLDEINAAIEDVLTGRVTARVVCQP